MSYHKRQKKHEYFNFCFQANSVFGKTMQNVRDYVSVKLHTSEKTLLKAISNVTFKSYTIIGEDLVQTNHFTPTITHDKPIAIGFTILELVIIINFFLSIAMAQWLVRAAVLHRLG